MPNGQQFDGVTPQPGYTLFHGRDGQSFYLRGENLSSDDISQRVAALRSGSQAPDANAQAKAYGMRPLTEAMYGSPEGQAQENEMLSSGDLLGLSTALSGVSRKAAAKANTQQGGYVSARAGNDLLARAANVGAGLSHPKSIMTAAAAAAAPEIVGPALLAHGTFTGVSNTPDALRGNPDSAERALLGYSEAAAGGATTGAALRGVSIPSLDKAKALFQQVDAAAGKVKVDVGPAQDVAFEAEKLAGAGNFLPKVFRDFIKETTNAKNPAMDFARAREFESSASRLSVDEALKVKNTPMAAKVKQFAQTLREVNNDAADQAGVSEQFDQAMRDYGRAKNFASKKEAAADLLKKQTLPALAKGLGIGAGGTVASYAIWKLLKELTP
jgi:hypothetical protein